MARLVAVNWIQVLESVRVHFTLIWSHMLQFLDTQQVLALIAALIWFLMASIVLCWFSNITAAPP